MSDIANGTGGYLLLTGNPGVDDQVLLQKYFAQVLAGATNAVIVVDPPATVPPGGKSVVPFNLTDADIRADVLFARGDVAGAAGRDHRPRRHQHHRRGGRRRDDRRRLPGPAGRPRRRPRPTRRSRRALAGGGSTTQLKNWLARLRKLLSQTERGAQIFKQILTAIDTHGVPYTVSVQARSALRMIAEISQQSRLPGHPGRLDVTVTDSGVPLAGQAAVHAQVTPPTGTATTVTLSETGTGGYRGEIPTSVSGVYRILVTATGADLRGTRFTREEFTPSPSGLAATTAHRSSPTQVPVAASRAWMSADCCSACSATTASVHC